ncbi:MAG: signal peptide peptidase SppA [Phycisphaeraceae bacterium]|nr:signal peptide peptidase SppA [Phycisphaeraceae bacterium]
MSQYVAVVLVLVLGACSPLNFSVNLGATGEKAREAVVLRDPGAWPLKIALIDLNGVIADARRPQVLGVGANPVDEFVQRLERAERDGMVRGVIVRINSPGGTVVASELLYDEIRRFRARSGKPVVASMGEVAASGGYFVALACDAIIAQPSTITGSIGVILPTMNISEGLSRIGVRSRAVTSAGNKDLANPFEPMDEAHYVILQGLVDDMYGRFREKVATGRPGIRPEDLESATDGRVYTGAQAIEMGLVDELGGVREAFDHVKALAGIEKASLIKYHDPGIPARTPYASSPETIPGGTEINVLQIRLDAEFIATWNGAGAYYLWMP